MSPTHRDPKDDANDNSGQAYSWSVGSLSTRCPIDTGGAQCTYVGAYLPRYLPKSVPLIDGRIPVSKLNRGYLGRH